MITDTPYYVVVWRELDQLVSTVYILENIRTTSVRDVFDYRGCLGVKTHAYYPYRVVYVRSTYTVTNKLLPMFPEEERICCAACLTAYLTVTPVVPFGGEGVPLGRRQPHAVQRCDTHRKTPRLFVPKARYDLPRCVAQLAWQKAKKHSEAASPLSCSPSAYQICLVTGRQGWESGLKDGLVVPKLMKGSTPQDATHVREGDMALPNTP